ncbi:MAG: hypothetical protein AAF206_08865 [Bacteroidota bacterium]
MASFSTPQPEWVIKQILSFLNQAKTAEDIVAGVQDDPSDGAGAAIGKTVAQRILDHRNSLRPRFFRSIDQLTEVEGVGQDKLDDLAYTFQTPAADWFVNKMFAEVIGENWTLTHLSHHIEDPQAFEALTADDAMLKMVVSELVAGYAQSNEETSQFGDMARIFARETFADRYEQSDYGRFAWALWFYQFDADNWFSFERVRDVIVQYLDLYWNEAIEVVLLKNWPRNPIWHSSPGDLPVTINRVEQTISIWQAELFD